LFEALEVGCLDRPGLAVALVGAAFSGSSSAAGPEVAPALAFALSRIGLITC